MENSARKLHLQVLTELENTISQSNIDSFKKLSNLIDYTNDIENQINFQNDNDNASSFFKNTNFVILACKYNKVKILKYLFNNHTKDLKNLYIDNMNITILPCDKDEEYHNAFYYAIRSGNIELLDTLINKWPNNYFSVHLDELDEILSTAYEELKLKNVPLSEEVEIFIENKLINLRFFSNTCKQDHNVKDDFNNVRKRIELVLQNINLLQMEYSNIEKPNGKCLFILRFIAQNIYILKHQLKSTYDTLPWEEIEFCLISFLSLHTTEQEFNLFYYATLNKNKILKHLENFAKRLENNKDIVNSVNINKFANFCQLKREKIVTEIISNYPEFKELYTDYQQIRDIYSLKKISDYLQLASSADPKKREGQLIIIRVLQVIGEYLKNTLECPKLSSTTSELLLLSLPKNTRQVIIDLRNSLSHAYSLSKRTDIEDNKNVDFYIGVQNDTTKIGDVITRIYYDNKIKMIRILLKQMIKSESLSEIKEHFKIFNNIQFDSMFLTNFEIMEHMKLEKLVNELSDTIIDQTDYEKQMFKTINAITNCAQTKLANIHIDYTIGFSLLKGFSLFCRNNKINHNIIRGMKFSANKALKHIVAQVEFYDFKEIAKVLLNIYHSVMLRAQNDTIDKVNKLFYQIIYIVEFETGDIKWIEELREKLKKKSTFIPSYEEGKTCNITREKYNNQLSLKLSELKNILKKNALGDKLIEKLPSYKRNKKLQAVVEMLVLDIMSILGCSKECLENNFLFLDDNSPLLNGKCLRNHLAHGNALIDVLLFDPLISVLLNAKKLISESIMRNKKRIGKRVVDNPSKLTDKYNQNLNIITNQQRMFIALEDGNIEDFKDYLKKGADINARNINSWTTLHFAAKGSNVESIKFIIDQNFDVNAKDINGQNSLHIAAAHERKNIVEFFLKETDLHVDNVDNSGQTALHIAAQNGHKDIVEILIKNNADINIHDKSGFSPLRCAIQNNHVDIAKILQDIDLNDTTGNFTSLHIAAENGHLEIVNFLLRNGTNVNARTDRGTIPLHTAALNGHLDVVNTLILKGADVNSRVMNGCTPLHYAVENGHKNVVNILLKHGANVNAVDKTYNNTPLHYAAEDGHEEIVKALLKNKANAGIATVNGLTPLHLAVMSGHLKIVAVLLKHGVDIHAKDKNNASPLNYAAEYGYKEVVEFLIKNRANVNDKDNNNVTSMHIAALKGHKDIIDLLIRNKGNITGRNIEGSTPLHAAATSGNKDVIDLLIQNKAEVDARTNNGMTPLHMAAMKGSIDAVDLLITNKADVNTKTITGVTPLHLAIVGGHKEIVNLLIKNKARINEGGIECSTSLQLAVELGYKEIIEVLMANGANVNTKGKQTPLLSAIKCNNKEIVEFLIANGANVNAEGSEPLSLAVVTGYGDMVEILLRNKAYVNIKYFDNFTPLHLAAKRGFTKILNALIRNGANIDAVAINNITPLFIAVMQGHKEISEILIANGASVDIKSDEGNTPLHFAAAQGYNDIVKVLLNNKANASVKDNKNRTPLELAVAHGHLQVVKMLLQYEKVDRNTKGNDDWGILHIASQESNLEMVKYLIDEGFNINATNASGSKPIHIAAREGYKDIVEFFLSKGSSINESGIANQTLLHYAVMKGHLEVMSYLIAQGADINAQDANGLTPMHIAAHLGCTNVIKVLLENGAVYNIIDKYYRKPLENANDKIIINLLSSTEKLFEAVKRNSPSEVENYAKAGASVNAKKANSGTPLHYAAWKGYGGVVNILLRNKANCNAIDNKGLTPLHYAAKFSHLQIVKALMSNGAVYNAISESGKTPSDFAVDKNITNLFKLLTESFKNIKNGNSKVINELDKIKDVDTIKAIMGACDKENKTLLVAAVHSNFSKLEQLKEVFQGDISAQIKTALVLTSEGNYQKAISIFRKAFEKRKEILGPDNPGTLDIQLYIAKILSKQGAYQEALNMLEEIIQKQKRVLGFNDKNTLFTRSTVALVLHRLGKHEEASNIYKEVYQKQKEILGSNHSNTLYTQFHMALVLNQLGDYEEALNINKQVFEKRKEILGIYNPATVSAKNNIAMVLTNQCKHEEALKIYKEVFEQKKMILGIRHADTLRTLNSIAVIFTNQAKYHEALKTFQEVINIQKNVLGQNHPETLNSQYNLANVVYLQGKWIDALKAYREVFDRIKAIFGPSHPTVLDILARIETINLKFKLEGTEPSEILQHLQKDINIAASNGDIHTVQSLLKNGADLNDKDVDGRTPLHYSVSNGQVGVVKILLKNGADVTQVTNKDNTPLHIATSKNYKEIVQILLQHVNRKKLSNFINAKTTSGTTPLHVAAKIGSLEIVKSLLKHGATYNIENKEGKKPLNLSGDQSITSFLKLVEELFEDAKNGNVEIIKKLRAVNSDELLAVTNARNNQGNTCLQVTIVNNHKHISSKLLEMLTKTKPNQ